MTKKDFEAAAKIVASSEPEDREKIRRAFCRLFYLGNSQFREDLFIEAINFEVRTLETLK